MASGPHSSWAQRLRAWNSCSDALAGTSLDNASKRPGYVSELLLVPDFIEPALAEKWYAELKSVKTSYGACISRGPHSPYDPAPQRYSTVQFFRGPCTCKYEYAGTARHQRFFYKNGADVGPPVISEIEDHLGKSPFGRGGSQGCLKALFRPGLEPLIVRY